MRRGLLGTLSLWAVGVVILRVAVIPAEHCPSITATQALEAARQSAGWIERAQRADGSYLYEYDRDDDRESPEYNAVRHAGVTMGLYQLAAAGEASVLPTADQGLAWMRAHLLERDGWAALEDAYGVNVELGASALMLAGLAQRRLATEDPGFDGLMHETARFLLVMQRRDGSFLSAWRQSTGLPDPVEVSRYATGEAFWALTLMHRLFPGEGWDGHARLTADYLSLHRDEAEAIKYPPWADQWAAHGLAEMASWPLNEDNVRYARDLAARFGFLMRVESQRGTGWFSKLIHGRRARAAGMGTWVEGLDSLWRLADADPRMRDLRDAIGERAVCGAGMLADRQVGAAQAREFKQPGIVEGAWFTNGATRMDDQQHALSGLLRSVAIIEQRGGKRP